MAEQPVILSACRTAIGTFQGGLSSMTATQLGAVAIREAVRRAGIDGKDVDEVIMGQVVQAGAGQAPARQAAIHGGLPVQVPAVTINKVCGSGLKAVMIAAQSIKSGDGQLYVAGGMESMSNCPYIIPGVRTGLKFGDKKIIDLMILDGLWDSFHNFHMGNAAELTAKKSDISRDMQDEYAFYSQMKASKAIAEGRFIQEITPVMVPQPKGDPIAFETDQGPRPDSTVEKLGKLKPAFQKDGTVTPGNAPGLNDGAAALVVSSQAYAESKGLQPIARIVGYAAGSVEPENVFYAPIMTIQKLMAKMQVDINYWDLIEINEAFAVQVLADGKELGWDWAKVNVNGGAIALGHPIGASGARILATLIYALKNRGLKKGLASLCLGGGGAVAMAIELV
jgi:acetyl-CoA C-acetyltransferase